ncbi:hypothetical protein [Chitinimonas sp.]|uniref:hypothetical protein n=1 Tax=Chitinimonas sp. TaxID=1934313 RepID=UPI002F94197F
MRNLPLFRRISIYLMEMSVLITLTGFYFGYVVNNRVGLATQVAGHLMLLLGPSAMKFGYVLRLAVAEEGKRANRRNEALGAATLLALR